MGTDKALPPIIGAGFSWIALVHSGLRARLTWPSCCLGLRALPIAPSLAPPWKTHTARTPDPGSARPNTGSHRRGNRPLEWERMADYWPGNGLERASHIMRLAFDSAGDLWIACRGDGLYEWVGYGNWEGWEDQQGLPSASIWAIVPANVDRVFLGTESGPAWIDPRSGLAGSLSNQRRWTLGQTNGMLTERDGSLLAGTASGVILRIDPKTGRVEQKGKVQRVLSVRLRISPVAYSLKHLRVSISAKPGPQRQVFVAGWKAGAPSDRSSSLGWKPGPQRQVFVAGVESRGPSDRSSSLGGKPGLPRPGGTGLKPWMPCWGFQQGLRRLYIARRRCLVSG